MWPKRIIACALAVVFGMQWMLLHVVALGFSVLTDNSSTPLLKATVALVDNHRDCPVCASLNESEKKSGDSKRVLTPQTMKIESMSLQGVLVLGPNVFFVSRLPSPGNPGWGADPPKLNKPPQATA